MKRVRLRLNRYLDELGITRYELASRSGIKYQIIDNYYKNRVTKYDRDTLGKICTALDCKIEDILETEESIEGAFL